MTDNQYTDRYADMAFREEFQRLMEHRYHKHTNPHGIDNLPHAIKLLSLSQRGQTYKKRHNMQDTELQYLVADRLSVSKEDLLAHRDNPGTLESHVYHLDIPKRTFNALLNNRFTTIQSVVMLMYEQVLGIRGISEASIQDLIQSIKTWAREANIDIYAYPLIQTMADPDLWAIGSDDIKPYLEYPFTHILNYHDPLPITELGVSNGILRALSAANIRTLDELINIPVPQWINIKGLGRKSIQTLLLGLIQIDKRIAQFNTYSVTIDVSLCMDIEGVSEKDAYKKAIEHLNQRIKDKTIDIRIDKKEENIS